MYIHVYTPVHMQCVQAYSVCVLMCTYSTIVCILYVHVDDIHVCGDWRMQPLHTCIHVHVGISIIGSHHCRRHAGHTSSTP